MNDSITLHSYRRCPFAIRVRMVLEEKGIPYQLKEEKLSDLSSELLSLHPEGRVPLLIHQTAERRHVFYQSTVITEYLEDLVPNPPLLPQNAAQRAEARLWTYWCDTLFKPDLDAFKYELKRLSEEEANALRARLHGYFGKWEAALSAEGGYLVGGKLSLADIHLFPFARQFLAITPALPGIESYPLLAAWLARLVSRPAFERVMQKFPFS